MFNVTSADLLRDDHRLRDRQSVMIEEQPGGFYIATATSETTGEVFACIARDLSHIGGAIQAARIGEVCTRWDGNGGPYVLGAVWYGQSVETLVQRFMQAEALWTDAIRSDDLDERNELLHEAICTV